MTKKEKRQKEQWERLSLEKYPPELRKEIRAMRIAGTPHPMDIAYLSSNDRIIELEEKLDNAIEFGSGGVKKLGRKLNAQRNAVVREHGGTNYKRAKRDGNYSVFDDYEPSKKGMPGDTIDRIRYRKEVGRKRERDKNAQIRRWLSLFKHFN